MVVFKDGEKLVLQNPGNVKMAADGIHYELPHRDGVGRANASEVKYIYQLKRQRVTQKQASRNVKDEETY